MILMPPHQIIGTFGISGNASVVNVGRDHITYMDDDLGAETHAVLESIGQRLKVVHDVVLGMLASECCIHCS